MLDNHYVPEGYGIVPYLAIGDHRIPTYSAFVALALLVGIGWFYCSYRGSEKKKDTGWIVAAALLGGVVGAKLAIVAEHFSLFLREPAYWKALLFSGRSIVGGLVGGYLGVRLIKKIRGLSQVRCGNHIAPAAALGMGIGRIGCFLTGCCYGIETKLPIGVDFGDGVSRIPTQLIEAAFCFVLFGWLLWQQKKNRNLIPGILFRYLVLSYFTFRFLIEFIRATNKNILGLSVYQVICVLGAAVMIAQIRKSKEKEAHSDGKP